MLDIQSRSRLRKLPQYDKVACEVRPTSNLQTLHPVLDLCMPQCLQQVSSREMVPSMPHAEGVLHRRSAARFEQYGAGKPSASAQQQQQHQLQALY
jgi:hypothetical protein